MSQNKAKTTAITYFRKQRMAVILIIKREFERNFLWFLSLRKQPSFFAPGWNATRAGSEEGRLFSQANDFYYMLQNKEQLKEGFYLEGNRDFVRLDPRYDKYGFQTRMPLISAFLYFVAGFWHFKRKCHTTSSCFQVVQLPPLPCTTQPPNFWQVTVYEQKNSCSTQNLTHLLGSLMRYWVGHSKIKSTSMRGHVISSI